MRKIFVVNAGKVVLAVNVIVSCSADHVNVPGVGGVSENAACTEFVSIGALNCRTMGAAGDTLIAPCAGTWLRTTGSRGFNCDCAMKIFAEVPGTLMEGEIGRAS